MSHHTGGRGVVNPEHIAQSLLLKSCQIGPFFEKKSFRKKKVFSAIVLHSQRTIYSSFRVLMRIVTVQKLWLSWGKGLLSHRYSAPLRRTS